MGGVCCSGDSFSTEASQSHLRRHRSEQLFMLQKSPRRDTTSTMSPLLHASSRHLLTQDFVPPSTTADLSIDNNHFNAETTTTTGGGSPTTTTTENSAWPAVRLAPSFCEEIQDCRTALPSSFIERSHARHQQQELLAAQAGQGDHNVPAIAVGNPLSPPTSGDDVEEGRPFSLQRSCVDALPQQGSIGVHMMRPLPGGDNLQHVVEALTSIDSTEAHASPGALSTTAAPDAVLHRPSFGGEPRFSSSYTSRGGGRHGIIDASLPATTGSVTEWLRNSQCTTAQWGRSTGTAASTDQRGGGGAVDALLGMSDAFGDGARATLVRF
ncbi:Hypothetical protein, putative [Bodo saltans]|uniref:Uncharacterized protein n=1 Tax=Bodo saltans TaxID=75058 RepID=A0A0S4KH66_BODSA|nr:Hypothetical protein, putative [Bodo saltans]|eukprot:CUI14974.1 Hypothetical protein, putative [Bodo saltans]